MGRHQPRRRPDIQAANEYIAREEYRLCRGDGCKNVIAVGAKTLFCSRCRRRKERR